MSKRNKLHIAVIGHKRIPSREGGIEIVVSELAERMAKMGNKVDVYNRGGHHVSGEQFEGAESEYKFNSNVRIIKVPTIDKKGLAALTSSFFASLRAAFGNYDVVHYHAEGPCFMLFIPHIFRKRTVATIHGLDWQRAKWGKFSSWYLKKGEKMAAKYADEIIVLSRNVQNYFKQEYNRNTHFIPNGVNRPEIQKAEIIKSRFKLDKDGYFLYLGRIVPEKGISYLIEAFKGVRTDKKLVIAGGSSDTGDYMHKLKLKAKGDRRIIFTDFVEGKTLAELYSNAYIYVLPSDLEGMPLSLLEAMSYGNCCLVSDIPECAEVVEDKAVLFKKGNVGELRERLQELADNPELTDKYKSVSSDYICKKYNWDDVVKKTLKIYKIKNNKNQVADK